MSPPHNVALPWWRHGQVWLLVAGPAAVVVAGIVTVVIAVRGADPVLDVAARRVDVRSQGQRERAALPAHLARNHAATPAPPARAGE